MSSIYSISLHLSSRPLKIAQYSHTCQLHVKIHYRKSLIHDGDTVSVHRPSFYAKRFKQFMGEKVFKKLPSPLKSGPSVRRANLKRALSKESETYHHHFSSDPGLGSGTSNQDSGVITDSVLRGMKVRNNTNIFVTIKVVKCNQNIVGDLKASNKLALRHRHIKINVFPGLGMQ